MSKFEKLLYSVLCGTMDNNISFEDIRSLLNALGFSERIKGGHHIYTKDNIAEIINIQAVGNKAKPYQVKQIRNIILKYRMGGNENV